MSKKSALARKREAQEAKRRRERRLKVVAIGAAVVVIVAAIAAIAYLSFHKDTFSDVTELVIKDRNVGTGEEAQTGDTVTVQYTLWRKDGMKLESSTYQFTLGAGEVIKGWDQGIVGMKVGGTRILYIPPDLAYGEEGSPPKIPSNATLKFKVKLLAVE
jgi:FKBP-type peptidyl-prolyl cis-trans isomerase